MNKYRIKEFIKIHNGAKYNHLKSGNVPLYGSGGLMGYVDDYLYDGEAILLPRKGTLDNIMYATGKLWTVDTMYYATIDESLADPYYIYNYLAQLNLSHLDSGSTLPSMTKVAYYDLEVEIPSRDAQIKLIQCIRSINQKIELNNRINAELEAMAKTLYDYWFVQFDFPDANDKPYKSSGGKMVYNPTLKREIPEGWEVTTIGEYAEVKKGDLITAKDANDGSVKVIAAGVDYSYMHSESNRKENTITISGSGANAGYINFWREPIFASDCITVRGYTDVETILLLQHLRFIQDHITSQSSGSAQPHVYPSDIKILKYVVPPRSVIEAFKNLIIPANTKIANNIFQNESLSTLRDWLLPMLMNGQLTVK